MFEASSAVTVILRAVPATAFACAVTEKWVVTGWGTPLAPPQASRNCKQQTRIRTRDILFTTLPPGCRAKDVLHQRSAQTDSFSRFPPWWSCSLRPGSGKTGRSIANGRSDLGARHLRHPSTYICGNQTGNRSWQVSFLDQGCSERQVRQSVVQFRTTVVQCFQ